MNLNRWAGIGRPTKDPESVTTNGGTKIVKFGFAVSDRKKNQQTGQWEDADPLFIDCKAFNRQSGQQLADTCEKFVRKGEQIYVEGRLNLDRWQDKQSGEQRSRIVLIVENLQLLQTRGSGQSQAPAREPAERQTEPEVSGYPTGGNSNSDEIPFRWLSREAVFQMPGIETAREFLPSLGNGGWSSRQVQRMHEE